MAAKKTKPSPSTTTAKPPSRTAAAKTAVKIGPSRKSSGKRAPGASKAVSPVSKKAAAPKAAASKSPPIKATAPKAAASKSPPKKATVPKAAASKKTPVRKTGAKKAGTPAKEGGVTAATSLSAAAKRIQERERLRKKRLSDSISQRVAARAAANGNGHRPALTAPKKGKPLTARDLTKFRKLLLEFRDRIVGDISFLTDDSLHRPGRDTGADLSGASQHSADHGTDNFDREFALSLASTEQDVLYEVDEALQRIEEGTYGICEMTGVCIEKARLEVIPYTRFSVQAQAKMEQGRARYRPFAQTFRGW
jgi:RNA polymerase-binding transcription factor DksA